MTIIYYRAPADQNDTAGYRSILETLRATDADNDNDPAPRRAHSTSPRHRAWQEAFAPLMNWGRLREASQSGPVGSSWMAAPGDPAAPTQAESGGENLFSEEQLIMAASLGVRWKLVGGRLVPADGQLEYSRTTGKLIRCGALVLADDPVAANDDEPRRRQVDKANEVEIIGGIKRPTEPDEEEDEEAEPDLADVFGEAINPDLDRGRRNGEKVRAGEIVGVVHKTRHEGVKMRKAPRNPDGRFRQRKGLRPPPAYTIAPDDRIGSRALMTRLLEMLSNDTVMVLDVALRDSNFADIGMLFGKSGKHAERVGKQKLLAACAELEAALKPPASDLAA